MIKAQEFLDTMSDSIAQGMYNSASLNAIHVIISSIDALLIFKFGVVSASQNHEDAVKLLIELMSDDETKTNVKHALAVIKQKNIVEYFADLITEKQAKEIEKHVTRFFNWAKSKLPEA